MGIGPIKGLEDGSVKLIQRLVAANLDGPGHDGMLLDKSFRHRALSDLDVKRVEHHGVVFSEQPLPTSLSDSRAPADPGDCGATAQYLVYESKLPYLVNCQLWSICKLVNKLLTSNDSLTASIYEPSELLHIDVVTY